MKNSSIIKIKGARQHNLKNIDVEIPKNKFIVFTGISGSGKSSLAMDTIYAEGQRRYVESLSSYARQFLGVMDKPDVDLIEGLSPAIAIDQKTTSHNPRSTVGTVTEVYDFLRLLFARVGHPHCPKCGREISTMSVQQIADQIFLLLKENLVSSQQAKLMILSPLVRDRKGQFEQLFASLKSKGFTHVRIDKEIHSLSEDLILIKTNRHTIEAVVDRIALERSQLKNKNQEDLLKTRLVDSVEKALKLSGGLLLAVEVKDSSFDFPENPQKTKEHLFSELFACPACNLSLPPIEPRTFSFNSPHGACPACNGLGSLLKVEKDLILNPKLSISEGGILPFAHLDTDDTWMARIFRTAFEENGIKMRQPIGTLSESKLNILLFGTGERVYEVTGKNRHGRLVTIHETFEGVINELERRYNETQSEHLRSEIEKYMRRKICETCQGGRLKKEAEGITIDQKSIVEIAKLSIKDFFAWTSNLEKVLSEKEKIIAKPILKEINSRVSFLISVGLDYLSLDRPASTLAGGETQRIRLASQIGSGLSGVLYVLDEPSVGLHQRDNARLIATLKKLKELDNTVIVVEHDRQIIQSADWVLDFGPGAGDKGGEIVSQGPPKKIARDRNSLTGKYLAGIKKIEFFKNDNPLSKNQEILKVEGCCHHNLKNIDVSFPLGKFICITGVSGSGKSTLVNDILYHALALHFNPYHREKPGKHRGLSGVENIDKVILIDQSPIGRTPRSNPATYTGVFTFIRQLFAQTPEARIRGYKPGRFSFNVKGGRCEACQGGGEIKIEMQFLPDIFVECEVCQGKRYNEETLDILYREKSIAEVLAMTVDEACQFFKNIPGVLSKLQTLQDVGLGYIRLGQPAPTLSGGEAQRVKLASELSRKATGRTFYILDEPTTGLHFEDLKKLLRVLKRLVKRGNTVVIIEHNLDVIKNADFIIDLGPEGGDRGGEIVAEGKPEEIIKNKKSHTGYFLKKILDKK